MQIEKLSDDHLHSTIKALALKEREVLSDILKHLLEAGRRKLFSKFGYASLYEYSMRELGISMQCGFVRDAYALRRR
jgi:hypothetical protein